MSAVFFPITPAISTVPVADNKINDYSNSVKLSISSSLSPDSNCSCFGPSPRSEACSLQNRVGGDGGGGTGDSAS